MIITICSYDFGKQVRILEGYVALDDCRKFYNRDWFHDHLILEQEGTNWYYIVSSSYCCERHHGDYEEWLKKTFPIELIKEEDDDGKLRYVVKLKVELPSDWRKE